jgi:predicted phage terminase large subunit-like protein
METEKFIEELKKDTASAGLYLKSDFKEFISVFHKYVFNEEFVYEKFHIELIKLLEAIVFEEPFNLLINMPPGSGKSTLMTYFFCWTYAVNKNCNNIRSCYSDSLVRKFSKQILSIMRSDLYRELFGIVLESEGSGFWKIRNGGETRAVSMGGAITGFGAGSPTSDIYCGCINVDDAQKPIDAKSKKKTENVNEIYDKTLSNRRRNLKRTPIIVNAQRLGPQDLSAHILKKIKAGEETNWETFIVAAIDEEGRSFFEKMFPIKQLEIERGRNLDDFLTAYQQNPVAKGGNLFKESMFETGDLPMMFDYTYITADTAYKDKQKNDYTVFIWWGVKDGQMYMRDIYRDKITSDRIESFIVPFIERAMEYGFRGAFIEPKGHGIYLNQKLPKLRLTMPPIEAAEEFYKDRHLDKIMRANAIIPHLAFEKIMINKNIDDVMQKDIIAELIAFPNGSHDDIVDCVVDGVKYAKHFERGLDLDAETRMQMRSRRKID